MKKSISFVLLALSAVSLQPVPVKMPELVKQALNDVRGHFAAEDLLSYDRLQAALPDNVWTSPLKDPDGGRMPWPVIIARAKSVANTGLLEHVPYYRATLVLIRNGVLAGVDSKEKNPHLASINGANYEQIKSRAEDDFKSFQSYVQQLRLKPRIRRASLFTARVGLWTALLALLIPKNSPVRKKIAALKNKKARIAAIIGAIAGAIGLDTALALLAGGGQWKSSLLGGVWNGALKLKKSEKV